MHVHTSITNCIETATQIELAFLAYSLLYISYTVYFKEMRVYPKMTILHTHVHTLLEITQETCMIKAQVTILKNVVSDSGLGKIATACRKC